jgi:hypothetical protein
MFSWWPKISKAFKLGKSVQVPLLHRQLWSYESGTFPRGKPLLNGLFNLAVSLADQ